MLPAKKDAWHISHPDAIVFDAVPAIRSNFYFASIVVWTWFARQIENKASASQAVHPVPFIPVDPISCLISNRLSVI
jgi:hypothetical protein